MKFGPRPPTKLPKQDSAKVLLLGERWQRASYALNAWAEEAKQTFDFMEGRQWTAAQIAQMAAAGRPAWQFNIIAPVVRLVLGYHRNNRTDIVYKPGQDTRSTEAVAAALTKIEKAIALGCGSEWVDAEAFLDGIVGGRGFIDSVLDFSENDLGEVKDRALDPFTVKVDPDCDTYDLNASAAYVMVDRMVCIDEIEACYGKKVADLVRPFTDGATPASPISSLVIGDDLSPVRTFGSREDSDTTFWNSFHSLYGDFVDTYRKTIRLIDVQYKIREERNVIIDLETGDKKVIPKSFKQDAIDKMLLYAEMVNNPCRQEVRMVESYQWSSMVGDVMLYDAPSLYDRYTMTGFFPYFRRGTTKGMVADLIDPQREKNKRRNAEIEIVSKTSNGGWMYHENSLDPDQEYNLKKFGSRPGVTLKYKGEQPPTQIFAAPPAMKHERLENQADEDVRRISGVNESALGEQDNAGQSGRAIEARQRQATISIQLYMDNFKRTKNLVGISHLSLIQKYYTEQRIYRVTGDDNPNNDPTVINQLLQDPLSGAKQIVNDVTLGKYAVSIDDTPLSATFQAGQYEEMMQLLEKLGPAFGQQLPMFADLIIGMSSMPKKQQWIERFQQLQAPPPVPGAVPGAPPVAGPQPQAQLPPPGA